jgi:Uma2 family endonuclease
LIAEEFSRLSQPEDGSQQELAQGVIVTLPPLCFYHGLVCGMLCGQLGIFLSAHPLGWLTTNDSGVILAHDPDTVRGPDLAFWSRETLPQLPREGYPSIAPDLVVEVLSPGDVFIRVQRKVQDHLRAGVRLAWILVPEDRSIAVFRSGREPIVLSSGETLSGEDILPGFSCPVTELFP